jgi:hypothetical protein
LQELCAFVAAFSILLIGWRPPNVYTDMMGCRGRRVLRAGLIALSLLATTCTGRQTVGGRAGGEATSAPVRDLSSIATLQDDFNQDAGKVRLILLLSPT